MSRSFYRYILITTVRSRHPATDELSFLLDSSLFLLYIDELAFLLALV
jgi:hypothetical protein